MPLITGALGMLAKGAIASVFAPFVEEARDAALDAARDTVRGLVSGKMSVEEWANIAIEVVDSVKEKAVEEGDLRFVGGKLRFAVTEENPKTVNISFQLYFLDEAEKWQKAEAGIDIPRSKVKSDDLEELEAKGEIVYDVE